MRAPLAAVFLDGPSGGGRAGFRRRLGGDRLLEAPAPLRPQRTAIAAYKPANRALAMTLWGFEPRLAIIGSAVPIAVLVNGMRVTATAFGTQWLGLTIPFPLYGIFRYLYLVHRRDLGGSPSELLLTDRPLLIAVNRAEGRVAEPLPETLAARIRELDAAGLALSAPVEAEARTTFRPASEYFIDEEKIEDAGGFRLFIDDIEVNAGVTSDQIPVSRSTIYMSDMLGNRRFIASLDSVSSFSNFDFLYLDLQRRMNWGLRLFDNRSFFTAPDRTGHYAMENVPPGEYTIVGWHERTRPVSYRIRVLAGETTTIDFKLPLGTTPDT